MIAGIGLDLFETRRFKPHRFDQEFLNQVFTPAEIKRIKTGPRKNDAPARLFTVKESVRKALNRDFSPGWFWRRIRIGPGLAIRVAQDKSRPRRRVDRRIFHGAAAQCRRFTVALTLIEKIT